MRAVQTALLFTGLIALPGMAMAAESLSTIPPRAQGYATFCSAPDNKTICAEQMLNRMWTLHWVRIFNPDQPGVTFCGPDKSGPDANNAIVADVLGWLARHPDMQDKATEDAQDAALLDLYPCPVPYSG